MGTIVCDTVTSHEIFDTAAMCYYSAAVTIPKRHGFIKPRKNTVNGGHQTVCLHFFKDLLDLFRLLFGLA